MARRAREPVRVADAGRLASPPGARALGDLYHYLLTSSWTALLGFVLVAYVIANLAFASIYYLDGGVTGAHAGSFADMFFFSVQTMATIGYGKMTPASFLTNALVSLEALFGLVGLALMTGMMFAKFSLPSARVRFSRYAVVSRRDGLPSLMFRMANMRANRIVEAQIHVVFARNENTSEGERLRRFYDLPTTRDRNALLLAAGELARPVIGAIAEAQLAQQGGGALTALVFGQARVDRRDLDIFSRSSGGEQIVALEDKAEGLPAQRRQLVRGQTGRLFAEHSITAGRGAIETTDDIH